mgnify:CR=1 FL=1
MIASQLYYFRTGFDSKMTSANNYLQAIDTADKGVYSLLQKQWGQGFGGTIVEYKNSPLYYLRWIYESQWTAWGYNYDGTAVYFSNSPAGWLHRIDVNADAIFSRTGLIINALSDVKSFLSNIFERLASVVDYERRINENAAYLVDFQKVGNTTLSSIYQAFISLGDRWDSQNEFLVDWAKRWDEMDKGGSWSESDKGALFAKLDGISDRLSVEAGQTILDALLGEVKPQYINDQLTIVKEVARNRFPFCIPAMMQQMLGLMQSEAQVPHWEFDFFGSPLVLDLGDLDGFASVTRWASCFMLFLALLANTKRFIFDLGGGGK